MKIVNMHTMQVLYNLLDQPGAHDHDMIDFWSHLSSNICFLNKWVVGQQDSLSTTEMQYDRRRMMNIVLCIFRGIMQQWDVGGVFKEGKILAVNQR